MNIARNVVLVALLLLTVVINLFFNVMYSAFWTDFRDILSVLWILSNVCMLTACVAVYCLAALSRFLFSKKQTPSETRGL